MEIKLDKQVEDIVASYAEDLGYTPDKLVNDFLFAYMDQEHGILKCPECGHALAFGPNINMLDGDVGIQCGHCKREAIVNLETYEVTVQEE